MSTTLKELQRIEQEHDRRGANRLQEPMSVRPRSRVQGSRFFRWVQIAFWHMRWKTVAMVLLAGICLALAFAGIRLRTTTIPPVSAPATSPAPQQEVTKTTQAPLPPQSLKGSSGHRSGARDPAPPLQKAGHRTDTVRESSATGHPASRTEKVKPWYGDEIKVQAIVYGSDPEASLAVINGRTVHRGDVVNGFAIEAIEIDAVIIRQGHESWKATLGR